MKRYVIVLVAVLWLLASMSGCSAGDQVNNQGDCTINTTSSLDREPVLTVTEEVWEQTFCKEGLISLLANYTVTNQLNEGRWDTCVTPGRVSRLAKNNSDELLAGAILTNGDNGVIQFTFNKETGWEQGIYDETDTVEQYVEEITQELIDTFQRLSGQFGNAVWNEDQAAYVVDIEIPYSGPSLAEPSLEVSTVMVCEVFFIDGRLSKINMINGESVSVVHSFGTTPIPQLPAV